MRVGKGYTKTQVLEAIETSGGVMAVVQRRLGCASWETARKYVEKWKETQAAFLAESCIINDLARSIVIKDIQGGNVQTAKWWLERRVREEFSDKAGINPPSENIAPDNTLRIEIDDSTE
jgi:hypothetical protein